jgi:hypothetical protein
MPGDFVKRMTSLGKVYLVAGSQRLIRQTFLTTFKCVERCFKIRKVRCFILCRL